MPTVIHPCEYQYHPVLYLCPVEDAKYLPATWGLYFLFGGMFLYIGASHDLTERIPRSRRRQGFGDHVVCASKNILPKPAVSQKPWSDEKTFEQLEGLCIRAIYTIIYGNGIPLKITNVRHVEILPEAAWTEKHRDACEVAIMIARSVLYAAGVPDCLTRLPFYPLLDTGHPEYLLSENRKIWAKILGREAKRRKESDLRREPVLLLHPA